MTKALTAAEKAAKKEEAAKKAEAAKIEGELKADIPASEQGVIGDKGHPGPEGIQMEGDDPIGEEVINPEEEEVIEPEDESDEDVLYSKATGGSWSGLEADLELAAEAGRHLLMEGQFVISEKKSKDGSVSKQVKLKK